MHFPPDQPLQQACISRNVRIATPKTGAKAVLPETKKRQLNDYSRRRFRQPKPARTVHVAAPMPGVVSTTTVTLGQKVRTRDMLLSIEAMKMETAINADRDGTITRLHTTAGTQIDAKDLLMEIDSGSMN